MLSPTDETIIREAAVYLENVDTGFIFIEVNEPSRQNLLAGYLEHHLTKKTIIVDFERTPPNTSHLDEIKKQVTSFPDTEIFLILNLHTLARDIRTQEEGLVRDLNFSREPYTQLQKVLVFFFPTYFVDLIIRGARDFFDFVPMDFKFPPEKTAAFEKVDPSREMADERFIRNRAAFLESTLLTSILTNAERAKKLLDLADSFNTLYHYDKALEYLQECLDLSRKLSDIKLTGTTLNNIGHIYEAKGDYKTALHYLEQSLKINQEIGNKQGEASSLNNISAVYYARGEYDTALSYNEQGLKICQEIGDKQGEGSSYNNISQIYQARGDNDTALRYLERGLKIRQEIGDKKGEATTLANISVNYHARGDYDTALRYLEQGLKIRQEIGDKHGEGNSYNNISQIYQARGDYDTALRYLEQGLKICQETEEKHGEASALNNISAIYRARGDDDTALRYLEQSLKISKDLGNKQGESITLNNIAFILARKNNIKVAIDFMERVVAIDKELGLPDIDKDMDFLNSLKGNMKTHGYRLYKKTKGSKKTKKKNR